MVMLLGKSLRPSTIFAVASGALEDTGKQVLGGAY